MEEITETSGLDLSWSPNGKQIAFASYQGDGNFEIYLMNADGTGLTRLTDDTAEDRHPDWSADGTKIAFESNRGGGFRVWVMNADGTGQMPLSKEPPSGGTSFFNPAWAPDGTKIVFVGSYGISVMASDGTVVQERLTDSTAENYAPTWQPLPDTIAPKVTRVNPAENAKGIAPGANVNAIFSEAMRVDSINVNTIELFKKGSTTKVAAAVSYDAATDKARLDPTNSLKRGATYKAVVTTVAEDLAGNHLDQNSTTTGLQQKAWTFKVRN